MQKLTSAVLTSAVLIVAVMLLAAVSVRANETTSLPGGTLEAMPAVDLFGAGPQTFGSGITWFSSNSWSVFGYPYGYGFASNGFWDGSLGPMAGLNTSSGTMTFAFSTPISGVGGLLNYAPGYGPGASISVFDSGGNLIESDALTFTTDGSTDSSMFLGFQESSNDISSFTLSGDYIGITGLTTSTVPEPPNFLLLATGLLCLGMLALWRKGGKSWAREMSSTLP
ncbi:MAG: PEP-CTERM sorting domain-containing protein [Acidobacteria bacterium]|nr:MAG: PEP-CTERM sorting domain-containing protein [Acidobacteriota bacterium]